MFVQIINNVPFGIYKGSRLTPYGEKVYGQYKGYNIEVYTAKEENNLKHKLFYVSDFLLNFIKSKFIYFDLNNNKRIVKCDANEKRNYKYMA